MKCLSFLPALAAGLLLTLTAGAQGPGANSSVPVSDQMFRKRVWRQIDLREKQNQPMFAQGSEITRILIEAVKRGELLAYENETLTGTLTPRQVVVNMSYADEVIDDEWDAAPAAPRVSPRTYGSDTRARWSGRQFGTGRVQPRLDQKGKPVTDRNGQVIMETITATVADNGYAPPAPPLNEYRYRDLYELELQEDVVFDKRRSRLTHEIKTISLHVPSTLYANVAGIEQPVATFRYSDVVRLFRYLPETAIWFNPQNSAEHRNLADAFALRLFSSYITKVSNAEDRRLDELAANGQQGIRAAYRQAAEQLEYEYNLWSF